MQGYQALLEAFEAPTGVRRLTQKGCEGYAPTRLYFRRLGAVILGQGIGRGTGNHYHPNFFVLATMNLALYFAIERWWYWREAHSHSASHDNVWPFRSEMEVRGRRAESVCKFADSRLRSGSTSPSRRP